MVEKLKLLLLYRFLMVYQLIIIQNLVKSNSVIQLFEQIKLPHSIQSYLPLNIPFQREELIKNPIPDTHTITNMIPIIEALPSQNQVETSSQCSGGKFQNKQGLPSIQQNEKTQMHSNHNCQQRPEIEHSNYSFPFQNNMSKAKNAENEQNCSQFQNGHEQTTKKNSILTPVKQMPIQVQNLQQNSLQKQKDIDEDDLDDISVSISESDMRQLDQEYGVQVPTEQEVNRFIDLLHKTCPQVNFQNLLCAINTFINSPTSNQTQNQNDFNDNYSVAASTAAFTNHSVISDFHGSNYSYGGYNRNGYETPSFLNQNHPDFRPSYHAIQSEKYIRRHRSRRDFSDYGYDPKKSPEYRQNLQRRLAYVFVTKGYGLGLTRQTLREDVQNNLYNSLITSIIRVALRKLCDLIINHLKLNVQVFDSKDETNLRSPIANCRKWMNQKDLRTFYKIIIRIYSLNNNEQSIYPQQLVSLYNTICREHLHKKVYFNTNTTSNSREPIDFGIPYRANGYQYQKQQQFPSKQITMDNGLVRMTPVIDPLQQKQAYQKELLLQYLKYGNIERITEILNLKYKLKNTPQNCMSVIQRVIQNGLRSLVVNYSNWKKKMPHFPNLMLNDQTMGFIMKDRKNNKFRVTIIKMLNQLRSQFSQKVVNVVNYINNYVNTNNLTSLFNKTANEQKNS